MPFLSFLPAIKYFGHFQNPDTFVVDIYLLSAVDFAMRIGRRVNGDLLNELMQDTRCQLRDIGVRGWPSPGHPPVRYLRAALSPGGAASLLLRNLQSRGKPQKEPGAHEEKA